MSDPTRPGGTFPPDPAEVDARVSTERQGHVLVIRMQRAAKRNAIDAAMTAALDRALDLLDDDPDLWCGVLTGSDGVFCAGTDLANSAGPPTERGGQYGLIKRRRTTPLIAAVEGLAYGGGFELVLACDMLVAGDSARFGLPEVARGVLPTCGGLFRTWQSLPVTIAKQMVLTGRPMPARRAYELGLVNDLTTDGTALHGALELAEQVCENAPTSVSRSLQVIEDALMRHDAEDWDATEAALDAVRASADHREGIAAFLEKRAPHWTGH
ncbi:enoyl-CoA hydratase-related protein [Brevibacterium litoralis]|uniref:enoyl-CoA hydratase-related protein n=1 Tax=Brevibacterium litoralis TaxID=3138935 RepID=UPI0032EC9224